MKKVKFIPAVFAFLLAISSAFVLNARSPLSTTKDSAATDCPTGTLVQADTNCDTTDHSKGRCKVTVSGIQYDAFNSSNNSCQGALFIIN